MVGQNIRAFAVSVLSLLGIITYGCGGMPVTADPDSHRIDAPKVSQDVFRKSKSLPEVLEDTPSTSENPTVYPPVKLEVPAYLCRIPTPPSALLDEISETVFPTDDLPGSGRKKSVRSLTEPSGNLNSQMKARSIKGKPQSARRLPRSKYGGKVPTASDKALLKRIEEALLDPGATKVSLETMLSEWGESTIGVDDALVQHVIYFLKCFALCQREGTSATLQRSKKYLPQIKRVFAKHRLPEDLAFAVPFVESRFTETAQSNKGAVGMFQFLAPTALDYGVSVTCDLSENGMPGVDERLNWNKTSVAAARFLSDHRKMFNSILLALGSYHHGAATVTKVLTAISREGKVKSFDSIFTCDKLEAYSREYIPLCLAAAYLHRMVRETNATRMPNLKIQYVRIKKPTSLDKLSAQHGDLTTRNPDLAFAEQLYCYASTGGYLLITELNDPGPHHASSQLRPLMTAQGRF